MAVEVAGFAGFAACLDMTPADPDILAMPDTSQMIQLPWQPDVAWLPADVLTIPQGGGFANDCQPLAQTPRLVLKRVLQQAEAMGYRVKKGVECEYFLLSAAGDSIFGGLDRSSKPCYDQQALMRRFEIITEICDAMLALGWGAYQNDHEDANGQFEMNWAYADALVTADRHAFFKYMVKSIAEKHGMRTTFMPKPFMHLTGNGCHTHLSLWDRTGDVNLFDDPAGKLGLATLG
jgi:glutamine synthetase